MAINKIDPKAEHKYVVLADPAIDAEKSNLDEYKKDHDIKHLVFKEGEFPTYFILKNILGADHADLIARYMKVDINTSTMAMREDSNILKMGYETFDLACKEIEENGKREKINHKNFDGGIIDEVSTVINNRSQLGRQEKK